MTVKLKPGKNAKRKAQQIHAKRRACDRLGVPLTDIDLKAMAAIFTSVQHCCVLEKQSCRVSKGLVYYHDAWYPVIYDKSRKSIATVLHPGMLHPTEVDHLKRHCKSFGLPPDIVRAEGFEQLFGDVRNV